MPYTIRIATEDDIDALYDISCSVHLGPSYRDFIPEAHYARFIERYTPSPQRLARFYEKFITRFHDPQWHTWVAEENGEIIGFTVAHEQGEVLELRSLFVSKGHQGKGVGRALFETSCGIAEPGQTILLEVLENNHRAIKLYEKQGFEKGVPVDEYYGGSMIQMYKH